MSVSLNPARHVVNPEGRVVRNIKNKFMIVGLAFAIHRCIVRFIQNAYTHGDCQMINSINLKQLPIIDELEISLIIIDDYLTKIKEHCKRSVVYTTFMQVSRLELTRDEIENKLNKLIESKPSSFFAKLKWNRSVAALYKQLRSVSHRIINWLRATFNHYNVSFAIKKEKAVIMASVINGQYAAL